MSSQRQIVAKASLYIVLSSCAFGSLSALTVLIARGGLPLLPAMFWRYLIAASVLVAVLRSRVIRDVGRHDVLRLLIVGGCGQALITYLSLYALEFLPVGPLAFLFYTYPAWVAVISAMFGREELTLARIVALSIAMMGIVVMVGAPTGARLDVFGVALALGTAFLYALYLPALDYVQRGIHPGISSFYLITGVFVTFLIGNTVTGKLQLPATTEIWGYLIIMSILSTVIAFAALITGLRVLGPVRTSIIATIEPFFTLILGAVLLGESLTRSVFTGGALIATAVVILQLTGRSSETPAVSV
jgi:drug/metabolite transporter (DMT)-like permease